LPKPIEQGDEKLARKFAEFLKHGKNLTMIEISEGIAEAAANCRESAALKGSRESSGVKSSLLTNK
jgi:hypothetical protein